jgi:hypothetical protein
MPVYRAEVTWSGTSQTNANASFFLTARDDNETWAVEGRRDTSVGAAQFVFTFNAAPDPGLGTLISGTNTLTGADFSAYDSGGTVAIEKDTGAGTITFVSPLGNQTRALSAFSADDDSVLRPVATALQITRLAPLTNASDAQVKLADFYGKKDGTTFLGASLANTDPGIWSDFSFANFGAPANPTIPQDNAQEAAVYRLRFVYVNATDSPRSPGSREWRVWEGGDNIGFNPMNLALDAVLCPFSGNLYCLRIADTEPTQVFFAVSRDSGATWDQQALHTVGGATMAWPSLDVDPEGKILALWQNADEPDRQYWAISETYGKTWSSVSSVVGDEVRTPRARFHPYTGLLLYVYRDPVDPNLKVVAHDGYSLLGFTPAAPWATPKVVARAASDHWPALSFNALGEALVQWSEGDRLLSRSDSHGVEWLAAFVEIPTTKGQPSVWNDGASGLHYVLYQDTDSGDLHCFTSDNSGAGALAAGPSGLVLAGGDQQYGAVVTDPKGIVYALYQEMDGGSYVLKCRKSDSLSAAWVDA